MVNASGGEFRSERRVHAAGWGGRAEDRLKAELRANARASRADVGATRWECRVHAAGGWGDCVAQF